MNTNANIFTGKIDRYNGITIDTDSVSIDVDTFAKQLDGE